MKQVEQILWPNNSTSENVTYKYLTDIHAHVCKHVCTRLFTVALCALAGGKVKQREPMRLIKSSIPQKYDKI